MDYSQYDEADPDDGFSGGAGLAKMLMTLAVLGLVLGGGVYLAYSKKMKSEQAIELMTESVERLSKDGTYPAVSIVRDSLSRALEVVPDHPIAVSKLALLEAHSYMHNGEAEAKSRAETQLAIAESGNFEKAERFAARALIDIANDQQDKAYNDIKAIFDQRRNPPISSLLLASPKSSKANSVQERSKSKRVPSHRPIMCGWRRLQRMLSIATDE